MGFGKWFLVLAAGGIGAGVVVAGMTTDRMQKYSDGYALTDSGVKSGSRSGAHRDYDDEEAQDYALSEGSAEYSEEQRSGFGPPRGRMVILDGSGWTDEPRAYREPNWSEEPYPQDERPFVSPPPRSFPGRGQFERGQDAYQPGPRQYLPQQPAPRPNAPTRDSAAESAARAAGAAADVMAAEREGA